MFFQRMSLDARPDALRALHPSLNTPVVGLEDELAGPARAALAVLQGDDGRVQVVVAIRLLARQSAATYAPDEVSAANESLNLLIESALSFAESMGFLLDDDLLAEAGPKDTEARARARTLWAELLGSTFVEPVKPDPDGVAAAMAMSHSASGLDAEAPTEIFSPPEIPPTRRAVPLSKFRFHIAPKPVSPEAVSREAVSPDVISAEAISVATIPVDTIAVTATPIPADATPAMDSSVTAASVDAIDLVLAQPASEISAVSSDDSDALTQPPSATRLGRVRLLRRRGSRSDVPRPGWLQRFLSAF